jgi:hypothetical protein
MKFNYIFAMLALLFAVSENTAQQQRNDCISKSSKIFKSDFKKLCDVAVEQLNLEIRRNFDETRKIPFYQDAYVVRALCAAYDMTGNRKYLKASQTWADRMVNFQNHMIPKGGYYMNYGRVPSDNKEKWYVADNSSIAMGVLAVAVRSKGQARLKYLDSVNAFGELVLNNYIGPDGGVCNGLWPLYDGQWWCCSGIFGSFSILMYKETGQEKYKQVALGIIDWLNKQDFTTVEPYNVEMLGPSLIMYWYEVYSAILPYIEKDSPRYKLTMAQLEKGLKWMEENQASRGNQPKWDYHSQWGSKLGGLPFHLYVWSDYMPEDMYCSIVNDADKELQYVSRIIFAESQPCLSQLAAFAMMSYAERLAPGKIYMSIP